PLSAQGCPFDASYEQLEAELFQPLPSIRNSDGPGGSRRERTNPRATSPNAALSRPQRRR
ncbi:MAG: deoxyribodipyrimidine photo-lyase, partial [Vulcanococcus sp.]